MSKGGSKRKVITSISNILRDVVSIDMDSVEKIEKHLEMIRVQDPKQDTRAIRAFLDFRKKLAELYEEKSNEHRSN